MDKICCVSQKRRGTENWKSWGVQLTLEEQFSGLGSAISEALQSMTADIGRPVRGVKMVSHKKKGGWARMVSELAILGPKSRP